MLKTMPIFGVVGATQRLVASDSASLLPSGMLTDSAGRTLQGVMISIETYAVRIAFGGTTPTVGASGVGHSLPTTTSMLFLGGADFVATLRYINATSGQNGVIQVTPVYG